MYAIVEYVQIMRTLLYSIEDCVMCVCVHTFVYRPFIYVHNVRELT